MRGWIEPLPATVDPTRKALEASFLAHPRRGALPRGPLSTRRSRGSQEAIATGDGNATPEEAVFLAMAHFQTGDRAKARALLAQPWSDAPDGPSAEAWWAARGRRVLHREAARLILDRDFPPNPFAP